MRLNEYTFKFLLLVIAQILIWNFFNFSQYLTLTLLPAMMLTLPHNRGALFSMPLAFVLGLCVDLLCGVPGLCSFALVPVAFVRRSVMGLVFGSEMFVRGENLSFSKHSPGKIFLAQTILTALFLFIYIWVDGAGTRSLWFNLIKGGVSLAASSLVSFFIVYILCSESQASKWK